MTIALAIAAAIYLTIGFVMGSIAAMTLPFQTKQDPWRRAVVFAAWFVGWGPLIVFDYLTHRSKT